MSTKTFQIKSRLAALGKKQTDLYAELKRRGWKINSIHQFYQYTNELVVTPKAEHTIFECFKILSEWEHESNF